MVHAPLRAQRPEFHVRHPQDSCFGAELQLDVGKGELGGHKRYTIPGPEVQTAAANSTAVVDEENVLRDFATRSRRETLAEPRVHTHDASGDEMRKSQGILPADLGIEIRSGGRRNQSR